MTADPSENFRDPSIVTEQGPENSEVPVAVTRGGQRPKPSQALQESQETKCILSRNRKSTDRELAHEIFESALVAKSQFENETENEAKDQIPIPNTYQEAIRHPIYG